MGFAAFLALTYSGGMATCESAEMALRAYIVSRIEK